VRRVVLFLLCALAGATGARADDGAALQALRRDWLRPQAAALVADAARLEEALRGYCAAPGADLAAPRDAWRRALADWERLSAVSVGPLLEARTRWRIDFNPTRPRLIQRAIKAAPANAADMQLVGAPAKGFPALEWLLWTEPARPRTPECAYAVQLAADIGREAAQIEKGFAQGGATLSELVNQWVGGIARLHWKGMSRPLNVADTTGAAPVFPRAASGATLVAWRAQWQALRALAVPLDSLLRKHGKDKLSRELREALGRADAAMAALSGTGADEVQAASDELAGLRHLVESEVAPALGVSIGFSDQDGD
jgi:uncharacterized protein